MCALVCTHKNFFLFPFRKQSLLYIVISRWNDQFEKDVDGILLAITTTATNGNGH